MGIEIFLGEPPAGIKQWIKDHAGPAAGETWNGLVVEVKS